jgi:predicted ATPase
MQITSLYADHFKSLVKFQFNLARFNCLVGLNGSGKSTVLQFIDFLAQLMRGDMQDWLAERGWEAKGLLWALDGQRTIDFRVEAADGANNSVVWKGTYNPRYERCTGERISSADEEIKVEGGKYLISDGSNGKQPEEISFAYTGSILSQLNPKALPPAIKRFREFMRSVESLDTLTPERLRQRTRSADGTLGHGGRKLSAFLHEMDAGSRLALLGKLKKAYPQLDSLQAKSLRSGWKELRISERLFGSRVLRTAAQHINDGMLRLMAILAELTSDHEVLLFDEIENGINPELVEFVMDELVKAKRQVICTTHSPMILNYLDDDVARQGVIYLYKTRKGHTRSIPFFEIPSQAEKLKVMGPGEVFVDTDLPRLAKEIDHIATSDARGGKSYTLETESNRVSPVRK